MLVLSFAFATGLQPFDRIEADVGQPRRDLPAIGMVAPTWRCRSTGNAPGSRPQAALRELASDAEGHALDCSTELDFGRGARAHWTGLTCSDACGAVSNRCETWVLPVDGSAPTLSAATPTVELEMGHGKLSPWYDIQRLCGIGVADNCTPAWAVSRGLIDIQSSDAAEVIGGGSGAFRSQGIGADWAGFMVDLDLERAQPRTYQLTFAAIDETRSIGWPYAMAEQSPVAPVWRHRGMSFASDAEWASSACHEGVCRTVGARPSVERAAPTRRSASVGDEWVVHRWGRAMIYRFCRSPWPSASNCSTASRPASASQAATSSSSAWWQ